MELGDVLRIAKKLKYPMSVKDRYPHLRTKTSGRFAYKFRDGYEPPNAALTNDHSSEWIPLNGSLDDLLIAIILEQVTRALGEITAVKPNTVIPFKPRAVK